MYPDNDTPIFSISLTISVACIDPINPAKLPNTPLLEHVNASLLEGFFGKRHLKQGEFLEIFRIKLIPD